ncbi:hypothetical protein IWX64_002321, partial [Arthrobacter sp. CAN_A212]
PILSQGPPISRNNLPPQTPHGAANYTLNSEEPHNREFKVEAVHWAVI